ISQIEWRKKTWVFNLLYIFQPGLSPFLQIGIYEIDRSGIIIKGLSHFILLNEVCDLLFSIFISLRNKSSCFDLFKFKKRRKIQRSFRTHGCRLVHINIFLQGLLGYIYVPIVDLKCNSCLVIQSKYLSIGVCFTQFQKLCRILRVNGDTQEKE